MNENFIKKADLETLKNQLRTEIMQEISVARKPVRGVITRAIKQFAALSALSLTFFTIILYAGDIREGLRFKDGQLLSADKLENNFNQLHRLTPPVGAILAWHKSKSGTPTLPDGWMECNGGLINDGQSPYNGSNTPNLNSAPLARNEGGTFLRGASISGGPIQPDTFQVHQHYRNPSKAVEHNTRANSFDGVFQWDVGEHLGSNQIFGGEPYNGSTGTETRPVAFKVVWIMRIK